MFLWRFPTPSCHLSESLFFPFSKTKASWLTVQGQLDPHRRSFLFHLIISLCPLSSVLTFNTQIHTPEAHSHCLKTRRHRKWAVEISSCWQCCQLFSFELRAQHCQQTPKSIQVFPFVIWTDRDFSQKEMKKKHTCVEHVSQSWIQRITVLCDFPSDSPL